MPGTKTAKQNGGVAVSIRLGLGLVIAQCGLGMAWESGPFAGLTESPASIALNGQGSANCTACHDAGSGGSVQILGAPSAYEPDQLYNLTIRVSDPTKVGGGFQISVEANGEHAGTLIVSDTDHTQQAPFDPEPPSDPGWLTHTTLGREKSLDDWGTLGGAAEYDVQWQAPSADIGVITFYAAGNAVNNNLQPDGDAVYLTTFDSQAMPECDDGVACTVDSFDGAVCVNTPSDALCDNGDFCDGTETCEALTGCVDNADPCLPEEFCNEATDGCDECLDAGDCDDGLACTDDACDAGACTHTADNSLCPSDGLFCTGVESCDLIDGCVSTGIPCSAGEACFEATSSCGACVLDTDCDDLIDCTADTCVDGECEHAADDSLCADDGVYCNGDEVCDPAEGGCVSTGDPCVATGQTCDESAEVCTGCIVGQTCDDGDPCTESDTCTAGVCSGVAVAGCCNDAGDCDDEDPCTIDSCTANLCANSPIAGCGVVLDEDGDGVADLVDLCPGTAAGSDAGLSGCSCEQMDDDADGVNNCNDICAFTSGTVGIDSDGCACVQRDDDADGVDNCADACAGTLEGEAINGAGCAESQKDDDLDSVVNTVDECPRTLLAEVGDVDEAGCSPAQRDDTPGEPLPDNPGSGGGTNSTACGGIGFLTLGLTAFWISMLRWNHASRRLARR